MSGAVFTLGNSVSGSLGLGDALSKFGRVAATGLTIEQDPDTVNSYLTTRYAALSAVTSGSVRTFLNPSLVVIPSAYNNGILYSIHSKQVNTGDFTVTRNTEARRVNSAGRIASVGSGLPRLDYLTSGGTVGTPALLVEPAATNLALQSEDFLTTWSPTNTTVSGNVTGTTDPAGGNTADQIFETATSGLHFLAQTMTIVSGTTYAGSVFLKKAAGSPDWMQVAFSTTGLAGFANFNLTSGTVGNVFAGASGRIENYGNGWYRCTLIQTATANGTSGGPIIVFTNNTDSVTRFFGYEGNTATSIYVWGAQLEASPVATSYIPTTTGTGSRAADVISVSGAVSGSIGQTAGTIYCEFEATNDAANRRVIAISDGAATNRILLFTSSNSYFARIMSTDVTIGALSVGYHKVAIGYQQSGVSGSIFVSVDGGAVVSGTATSFPASLTHCFLGKSESAAQDAFYLNARIRATALYTTRLTNQQLQLLTT